MTPSRPRGGRAQGAVPPLLLVLVGLLVTVVAGLGLLLQPRGSADSTVAPRFTAVMVTSEARTPDMLPARVDVTSAEPSSARAAGRQPSGGTDQISAPPATQDSAPSPTDAPPTPATASPAASATAGPVPTRFPAAVAPSWIRITSGGVDGTLTPRGLAPDGKITPARHEILWFTGHGRVQPGEVGTAVIAGHVSWEGRPDVFANLSSVSTGDLVTVGYTDGTSRSFSVVSTAAVDKDELSRSETVWGAHPDRPRLAIITCDPALGYQPDGHTAANFVVIAEA